MKIKKYIASNIQEGKDRVYRELGEDAIILSTRTINKLDGSGGGVIEIVAAIDANAPIPNQTITSDNSKFIHSPLDKSDIGTKSNSHESEAILSEIQILRQELNVVSEIIRFKNISTLAPNIRKLHKLLSDSGISENLALNTIIRLNINNTAINLKESLLEAGKMLLEKFHFDNALEKKSYPQTVAFLGATGSGKTSSLVKLAIICKLIYESRVLIISADTIKIGGSDQLQAYSSIAGIQFRALSSKSELISTLNKETEFDFIFVDTAGTGPFNSNNIDELENLLSEIQFDYKYLLLQGNLSRTAISSTIKAFLKLKPTSLIISKLDETLSYGELIEALNSVNLPISYFSNGQNIPDDIEQADRKALIELLLPELAEESNNAK